MNGPRFVFVRMDLVFVAQCRGAKLAEERNARLSRDRQVVGALELADCVGRARVELAVSGSRRIAEALEQALGLRNLGRGGDVP